MVTLTLFRQAIRNVQRQSNMSRASKLKPGEVIAFKVYNRPHLADFYDEYSSLLDEHNKQRSSD